MKSLFWKKIEIKKQAKSPKLEEGLSLTYMNDKNKYIHFGNVRTKKSDQQAEQAKPENKPPTGGISFSINKLAQPQLGSAPGTSSGAMEGIYVFNPATNNWSREACKGRVPTKRVFQHSWYEAPNLFIYGGTSPEKKILSDMYVLNCETYSWKRFFFLEGPPQRINSALINLGEKKYLIGGQTQPENMVLNDIWELSFENVVWASTSLELPGIIWNRLEFPEKNQPPNLKGHAAVKISDSIIFVYGGYNQLGACTDTSIMIDIENCVVKHYETRGSKPSPRAFHKMLPLKENVVCLFGGIASQDDMMKSKNATFLNDFYLLNVKEGYWSFPNVGGYLPSPRIFFAFSGNESETHSELLVLGGKSLDGGKDNCLYILSEINTENNEAWGTEGDDDRRTKFKGYYEEAKRNNLPFVDPITLEFSEAEKIIVDQREVIAKKEKEVRALKGENEAIQERENQIKSRLGEERRIFEIKSKEQQASVKEKQQRNMQNQELMEKLKSLLTYEKRKRKMLHQKSLALQESMTTSENFIITVDRFYTKCLKDDLLKGLINEDVFEKLEKKKVEHKDVLAGFRAEFDAYCKKERHIKSEMKKPKDKIKALSALNPLMNNILTSDDRISLKKN